MATSRRVDSAVVSRLEAALSLDPDRLERRRRFSRMRPINSRSYQPLHGAQTLRATSYGPKSFEASDSTGQCQVTGPVARFRTAACYARRAVRIVLAVFDCIGWTLEILQRQLDHQTVGAILRFPHIPGTSRSHSSRY
jgi:hypothetical protein